MELLLWEIIGFFFKVAFEDLASRVAPQAATMEGEGEQVVAWNIHNVHIFKGAIHIL